jgi:ribosomal protein S18 acetylase RimI-like enzyme
MDLTQRAATTSDLPTLIELFERAHAGYGGFAERSVEDFRWRYLERPDVGAAGVIVVEDAQQDVVGYVVVGTSGTIFEFAIDPDTNRREVADVLIAEAEQHLLGIGIDEIVLHAPLDDQDVAAALHAAGYGGRPAIQQYLGFMDLPGVVDQVLDKHRDALPRGSTAVVFDLSNPRPWHPGRFSVLVHNPGSGSTQTRSLTVATSVEDLVGMIVGTIQPGRAVARGRVRIAPLSDLASGLGVLRAMRLRDPFFFTAGDVI